MKSMHQLLSLCFSLLLVTAVPVQAQSPQTQQSVQENTTEEIEELNPFDPNVEEILNEFDKVYEEETGQPSHLEVNPFDEIFGAPSCSRLSCAVWAQVVKSSQHMYLYVGGSLRGSWPVSTGMAGYSTPNFDKHPDGRIYDRYTSTKFPGGDYKGLGNMPYAVFIAGGFALHGTPQGNWPKLGTRASHGCIRMHPDNAYMFNRLVRSYGVRNVWITVQ